MAGRWPRVADRVPGGSRTIGLSIAGLVATATLIAAAILASSRAPSTAAAPTPSPSPTPSPAAVPTLAPRSIAPSFEAAASPTPAPIYEDLSGVVTTADLAHRYPIAVMLDDSPVARPQSGLSAASVVWQAPVEGGIPRYMAVFQAGNPGAIGPVRSARLYFVRWAAEWKAVYLHAGGPEPLKLFLRGRQRLVVNADGKRTHRVTFRAAPHNLYSDGARLRRYAGDRGATDRTLAYDPTAPGALQPFRDGRPELDRGPDGGTIRIAYRSERVDYRYERASNTWLRSVDGRDQHDALDSPNRGGGAKATGPRIAPTTVVVMLVPIRRSSSITGPALGRLEADSIGSNRAWIFADGRVTAGTWSKPNERSRTRFLDADGSEIVLPRGQIFVQVVATRSGFSFEVEPAG